MTEIDHEAAPAAQWADPEPSELEAIVATSRRLGWRAAVDGESTRRPYFVRRLLNTRLGNWHLLLAMPRGSRAADVGCGFGSLVLGLVEYFRTAVGVDMLWSRVSYAALRARQEGRPATFARASAFALPFGDRTLDLVTMNGVLEWAGLYAAGAPREVQLALLREARRVLAATGVLCVAIENRFAMETLLGDPDTHTQLRLAPALPRVAADALSRVVRRQPYRTYLYNMRGYQRLLGESGFRQCRVYDLVSSYNDYDFVVDPRDGAAYRILWQRGLVSTFVERAGRVRRLLARWWPSALGRVAYAFLLLGGDEVRTLLDDGHQLWRRAARVGLHPGRGRFACQGTSVGSLAIVTHDGERPNGVMELSLQPEARTDGPSLVSESVARAIARRTVTLGEWADDGLTVRCFGIPR